MLHDTLSSIKDDLKKIDEIIDRVVSNSSPFLRKLVKEATCPSGKKIRSSMTLLGARFLKTKMDKVVPLCAALELVHTASLVHDDIVDNSKFRRGRESFCNKFGEKMGILMGDYLWCCAINLLLEHGSAQINDAFYSAIKKTIEGEIFELSLKAGNKIGYKNYIKMIDLKTSSLFELASSIPAFLSRPSANADKFKRIGKDFGRAFQLKDDLNDLESERSTQIKKSFIIKNLTSSLNSYRHKVNSLPSFYEKEPLLLLADYLDTRPISGQNSLS